jgi:hypothetical protein
MEDHGHDDERCGKPVYGLTRGGNVKQVCDDCTHLIRLHKLGEDGAAIATRSIARTPPTPPPVEPAQPRKRSIEQPGRDPGDIDPIWTEPF